MAISGKSTLKKRYLKNGHFVSPACTSAISNAPLTSEFDEFSIILWPRQAEWPRPVIYPYSEAQDIARSTRRGGSVRYYYGFGHLPSAGSSSDDIDAHAAPQL